MNTNKKNDISNLTDVKLLVDSFYGKVRKDPMLKDIFNNKIEDRWPEHLEKMYRFWQTVLLEEAKVEKVIVVGGPEAITEKVVKEIK